MSAVTYHHLTGLKKCPKNIYELGKFLVKLIQQVYELLNVNQLADKKSIQI